MIGKRCFARYDAPWYTYAVNGQALGAAGERWYTGQANYVPGGRSIPLLLYETTGGLFNSIAPEPTTSPVGTGKLTFTSCSAATLTFSFTGGSIAGQSGSIDLARVGPTPASCMFLRVERLDDRSAWCE